MLPPKPTTATKQQQHLHPTVFTVPGDSADVEARSNANGPALKRESGACCVDVANAAAASSPVQMADAGEQSGRSELCDRHRCCRAGSETLDLGRRLWAIAGSVRRITRGWERGQMLETTAKRWGAPAERRSRRRRLHRGDGQVESDVEGREESDGGMASPT